MSIRLRFPPSPTGPLHLGGARTALFNWLFARKNGGAFVFRVEDTDKARSKPEFEAQIIEALNWLGLDWDEGIGKEKAGQSYRQSERTKIYKKYLEKLLEGGHAYWCYCSKEDLEAEKQLAIAEGRPPKYSGHCRSLSSPPPGKEPQVIRLKIPATIIEFRDLIRGNIKTDMALLGDFVIARNLDETPLYNFAVTIDDFEMNITHVIRGEDHISNTPKQILIQKALGLPTPKYGHLPLVLNPDRSKLSKRYAEVDLLSYRERGYLPGALINYLVLLGWHPVGNQEVFTKEELVQEFDIARVQKGGAIWNEEKLNWLNREHLKLVGDAELAKLLEPFLDTAAKSAAAEFLHKVVHSTRERLTTLADFNELAAFFFKLPDYPPELLIWKEGSAAETKEVLSELDSRVLALNEVEGRGNDNIEEASAPLIEKYGKGNVLWPLRVALSGLKTSPDPYTIAHVLGKEECLTRLEKAEEKIGSIKQ